MIKIIQPHTQEEYANAIAGYWPGGKLFAAKYIQGTNMRNLIRGLAAEHVRAESYLIALQEEFIPDNTNIFLDEWERVLGIPDDCFGVETDNDIRRRNILVKLASLGVQTVEDFENLALNFGLTVNVVPGNDYFNGPGFPFPITEEESRYYIVVEFSPTDPGFPYTFPLTFGLDDAGTLECLYNNLKPANCEVLFVQL